MRRISMFLFVFICFSVMFTQTASAYIDPSVTTYLIQVIAGVVIAVGAVVGIYFRKAKKKISEKMGVDENAKKEVEGDIVMMNKDESKVS